MKKYCLLIVLLLGACSKTNTTFPKDAQLYKLESGEAISNTESARDGAVYGIWKTRMFDSEQSISFVRYPASGLHTEIVMAEREQADSLSEICLDHKAIAGINGSYFNVTELTAATYIKDDGVNAGVTAQDETYRTNGAYLSTEDGFVIDAVEASTSWKGGDNWWEVMVSGPILIDDGQTFTYQEGIEHWEDFYEKRHPRSMIGRDKEGFIWLVVVDGRFPGIAEGMSIAEMTQLARNLGLVDALNLDGGGSSTLWTLSSGVISHPCYNYRYDNEGQRVIPNALVVGR